MPVHESKICPRCAKEFICKTGDVSNCQCRNITLNPEIKIFIESRYNDCLCIHCLKELNDKPVFFKEKFFTDGKR